MPLRQPPKRKKYDLMEMVLQDCKRPEHIPLLSSKRLCSNNNNSISSPQYEQNNDNNNLKNSIKTARILQWNVRGFVDASTWRTKMDLIKRIKPIIAGIN
jgi:hypothetical protein